MQQMGYPKGFRLYSWIVCGGTLAGEPEHGNTKPTLAATHGPLRGRVYVLGQTPTSIGRNPENGIVLEDEKVSRLHCEVAPGDR